MDWIISLIFFIASTFFLVLGGLFKNKLWIYVGFSFLLVLGIMILATGLSVPSGWVVT